MKTVIPGGRRGQEVSGRLGPLADQGNPQGGRFPKGRLITHRVVYSSGKDKYKGLTKGRKRFFEVGI